MNPNKESLYTLIKAAAKPVTGNQDTDKETDNLSDVERFDLAATNYRRQDDAKTFSDKNINKLSRLVGASIGAGLGASLMKDTSFTSFGLPLAGFNLGNMLGDYLCIKILNHNRPKYMQIT